LKPFAGESNSRALCFVSKESRIVEQLLRTPYASGAGSRRERAVRSYLRARSFELGGELEKAVSELERLLETALGKQRPEALLTLARCRVALGEPERALEVLKRGLVAFPGHRRCVETYFAIAVLELHFDLERVIRDLERIGEGLRKSGEILAKYRGQGSAVAFKDRGDPVTEADLEVDTLLREFLPQPGDGWLSEETADDPERLKCSRVWIVDQMTYGLINVRTDGERILLAVMEEGDPSKPEYHIETIVPSELVPLP